VDEKLRHLLGQFGAVEHQVLALELRGQAQVVEGAAGQHRSRGLGFAHALQAHRVALLALRQGHPELHGEVEQDRLFAQR
jgi:hypothetical protein